MPHHLGHLIGASATALLMAACAPRTAGIMALSLDEETPYAIYDVAENTYIDLPSLVRDLATADVVFFGEYHDDPVTHRLEYELLRALGESREQVVLGLEMFERDVQGVLGDYVSGQVDEEEFLRSSRPWPNYAADYRPMVALARERGWDVIATNLPQALATGIARGGLRSLEALPPDQRRFAAAEIECPTGAYWDRFVEAITESADSSGHVAISEDDPMFRPMFEAQCARDEAMAETIAAVAGQGSLVYHVNGAFHSDYRLGIVPRLLRRRTGLEVRVISAIPIQDLSAPDLEEYLDRADYLIFTPEPEE